MFWLNPPTKRAAPLWRLYFERSLIGGQNMTIRRVTALRPLPCRRRLGGKRTVSKAAGQALLVCCAPARGVDRLAGMGSSVAARASGFGCLRSRRRLVPAVVAYPSHATPILVAAFGGEIEQPVGVHHHLHAASVGRIGIKWLRVLPPA
jgi:hypothetical protein